MIKKSFLIIWFSRSFEIETKFYEQTAELAIQ